LELPSAHVAMNDLFPEHQTITVLKFFTRPRASTRDDAVYLEKPDQSRMQHIKKVTQCMFVLAAF